MQYTMPFTLSNFFQVTLHILLLFSFSSSQTPSDLDTTCSKTLYPSFCKSILAENNLQSKTIQDYGHFCLSQSLLMTNNFKLLVNQHLQSSNQNNVSQVTKFALQDCRSLTSLNIDLLSTTANMIKPTNNLSSMDIVHVQTMLSAAMTNLDTCLDGLKEARPQSSMTQSLSPRISNNTMLLSLSLALFIQGWVPKNNPNDYLALKYDQIRTRVGNFGNSGSKLQHIGEMMNIIIVNTTVVVNPDGSGDFTTINDAITAAPINRMPNTGYYGIYVATGVYQEYINIPSNKKYLLIVGDGINQTIITGNRSVGDNSTTYNSATFAVNGVGFVATDITIRNIAGAIKHQAVALRNSADLSAFYRCSFEGYQDTLYAQSMRQFYKECDIYGTVDFIFGNAAAVFQNCNLYARQPLPRQFNLITAQGRTDPNQNTGFSIQKSMIRAADDLASSNFTVETYLGRPWKEYSRTIFMQSFLDNLIQPLGWHEWNGSFALGTLYYGEYNNTGLGSNTVNRVTWPGYHVIIRTMASYFTVSYFIVGDFWLPSTGVPYTLGLF
ncbi:pectinesterase-like [Chenopodium quinoa]|uniref:pectinesterase-like n=1 Tax=Chenopodium quinoa TaxID=63459 RepID=UPI000B7869BE|nr:pectinesterase-like [Chenopodium quinoa]